MSKKIKLILGLGVALFIITALGLSKVEAAEVIEKQTKQISNGKIEVITETKEVNGEKVKILKDVKLDFSAKVKGDVNGDGIVSVEDASYMLIKAVADTLNDETKLSNDESNYADINGDGAITVKDAQYVLTYYAKKAAGLNPSWEIVIDEVDNGGNNSSNLSYTKNDTDQIRKTGIEGYYKNGDKQYTVYAQGFNDVWGSKPYWDSNYGLSACGITSVATILSGFGVNKNPVDVNNDGIITNGNTLPSQLKAQFSKYGLYCSDKISSKDEIIENLKKGNPVFVNVHNSKIGNNYYYGHYVALLGISDDGKIFLADPAGASVAGGNNTGYFDQDEILPGLGECTVISNSGNSNDNNSSNTPYEKSDTDEVRKTGIEGYYKNGDKLYTVYAQGFNDLWGPKPYSVSSYANCASGITNIATLLSGFGVNKNPEDVDADGIIKIDNLYDQLKNYFSKYGVSCTDWDYSKENIIDHLKSGNPVFAYIRYSDGERKKIGNNYYSGHYVSLLGISSDGKIFLADPAGGGRNTGYFDQDDIIPGITSCVYISKDSVSVNESNSKVTDSSKKYDGTLDFDVNIDHQNSLPKLNENQLKQIVNNSDATQEAKNNMLSVIPDLVKYQDQYKVNAVFIMAFLKEESDWGTVEELVNSNTYNWGFIYGNLNGGYIDKHGNSWNKYKIFSEATEDLIKIISDSNGNYFGKQKYTIHELGDAICGGGTWNDHVSAKVQYFYDIINIDVK